MKGYPKRANIGYRYFSSGTQTKFPSRGSPIRSSVCTTETMNKHWPYEPSKVLGRIFNINLKQRKI